MVSTSRTYGTGTGVRRSKRPLSAYQTRRKKEPKLTYYYMYRYLQFLSLWKCALIEIMF